MTGSIVSADPAVVAATKLVEKLLRAGGHRGKWVKVAAGALGRALVKTTPGSEHGKLLAATLRTPKADTPVQAEAPVRAEAPAGVDVVLGLARAGITPTAAAVADHLERYEKRRRRQAVIRAFTPRLDLDGPRAAAWVAQVLAETGTGPTWWELAIAMDWPTPVRRRQVQALLARGWLVATSQPRSLRPGPAAHPNDTVSSSANPDEDHPSEDRPVVDPDPGKSPTDTP
jgi:DNA-binding IclR family transcriptional regulator